MQNKIAVIKEKNKYNIIRLSTIFISIFLILKFQYSNAMLELDDYGNVSL